MVICGINLKANEARLVTLRGKRDSHELICAEFNKMEMPKNPTQDDAKTFAKAFVSFCSDNKVTQVVVNRRATAGQMAGGGGTFIIEGILLMTSPVPVKFVHPATIKSTDKKDADKKTAKPETAELAKAYDLAFEGLA